MNVLATKPLPKIDTKSSYDIRHKYLLKSLRKIEKKLDKRLEANSRDTSQAISDCSEPLLSAINVSIYREAMMELAEASPCLHDKLIMIQKKYDERFEAKTKVTATNDINSAIKTTIRLEKDINMLQTKIDEAQSDIHSLRREIEQLRAQFQARERVLESLHQNVFDLGSVL